MLVVVYELGSKPEVFYILRSGELALETIVEIEESNCYPIVNIRLCHTIEQALMGDKHNEKADLVQGKRDQAWRNIRP